uniref:p53 DNA-binding domain-containing protein n=1 Tax=Anopheles farauti TaxID=69004 RepID=A0A3F2YX69_9DIPT
MDFHNAELFGDIDTEELQNVDDYQLCRLDTKDLLPAGTDEALMNDLFRDTEVAQVYVKLDSSDTKPKLFGTNAGEMASHLNIIPSCKVMSYPPHYFTVVVSGKPCSASSWFYSTELDKLFVKKKTAVTFDVSCNQANEQNLKVRIMLVYTNPQDVCKIVTRCQDDIAKDKDNSYEFKQHVVRCLNPGATYTGRDKGVVTEDRFGVLLDLNGAEMMQHTVPVSLEFLCQNSCPSLERRPTSLLFMLENEHGTLLGRKSISVKICSCPKRDMDKEEKKVSGVRAATASGTKRKHAATDATSTSEHQPPPRKLTRQSSIVDSKPTMSDIISTSQDTLPPLTNATVGQIKREHSFTTLGRSLSNLSNGSNPVDNDSSAVVLTLRLPDIACANEVAMYAFKHLASVIICSKDEQEKDRYARYLSHCRRVKKNFERSAEKQDMSNADYDSS